MDYVLRKKFDVMTDKFGRFCVSGGKLDPNNPVFKFPRPAYSRDFAQPPNLAEMRNSAMHPDIVDVWKSNFKVHEPAIKRGANELFADEDGTKKPNDVIIVGCGPSIKDLKLERKEGYTIITTNSALQYIDPAVVDYHMVLDYECRDWWFDGDIGHIPLICSVFCNPVVLTKFEKVYHYGNLKTDGFEEESEKSFPLGVLFQGQSVLYSAFHMAYKMGAKRIIFVGADGCYTNGQVHDKEAIPVERLDNIYLKEDINGSVVMTERMYEGIADNISASAKLLKTSSPDVKVINATGCGIMKEFMEIMDLEEVYNGG